MSTSSGFTVTIPGDPPSTNHMYRVTRKNLPSGGQRAFMAKTTAAHHYTSDVALLVRSARPKDFQPLGQIIVVFDFLLKRNKDTDNIQKALNDGIRLETVSELMGHADPSFTKKIYADLLDETVKTEYDAHWK